jgi:hypothetical protein
VTGWKQRSCVPPGRVKTNKQTNIEFKIECSVPVIDDFFRNTFSHVDAVLRDGVTSPDNCAEVSCPQLFAGRANVIVGGRHTAVVQLGGLRLHPCDVF